MSAPFIIPFNFQPITNPIRYSSSVTVTSTQYALVEIIDPTGFTIDAVSPLMSKTVSLSSLTTGPVSRVFTPTDGYMGYSGTYTRNSDGGSTSLSGSVSDTSQTLESFSRTGAQSGTYNLTGDFTKMTTLTFTLNTASGVVNGSLTLSATVFFSEKNRFWVKQGTILSGKAFTVTYYAAIT
jgi:hypothetical protein